MVISDGHRWFEDVKSGNHPEILKLLLDLEEGGKVKWGKNRFPWKYISFKGNIPLWYEYRWFYSNRSTKGEKNEICH